MYTFLHLFFNSAPTTKNYFPALTGLRAVAAYLVFLHHVQPKLTFLPNSFRLILMTENSGLLIFFTLSSFLIFYRYGSRLAVNWPYYRTYITVRLARIYPLYFVLTIITLVWQHNFDYWIWFLNLSLLKGYFLVERFSGIGPGWSLSVQESFYLAVPVLYWGFIRFPFITLGLSLLTGGGLVLLSKSLQFKSFMPSLGFMLNNTFFGFIISFYAGYLLTLLLRYQSWFAHLAKHGTYLGLGLMIGCLYWVNLIESTFPSPLGNIQAKIIVENLVFPFCLLLFLFGLLTTRTWISRLLASGPAQMLGRGSYAFYLLHTGLFYEAIYFHVSKDLLVIFVVLNVVSIVVYYFFEQPVYSYLRQRLQAKKLLVPGR